MFGTCLHLPLKMDNNSSFDKEDPDELPLDLSCKTRCQVNGESIQSKLIQSNKDKELVLQTDTSWLSIRRSNSSAANETKKEYDSDFTEPNDSPEGPAEGGTASGLTPKRNRERSLLPCEVCGKAFDRPSLLKRHIRTHTGEKPHICDYCGKGFSTSSSLNTHRRIHSGEKPHQCPTCGKRFTASSNLYYHRMTHVKEKPHRCNYESCQKSFPTPGDLKSHLYVHNGSWPFHCHICKRGFSKQTNLRNHLFLHTGKKPFTCSQCGKSFALSCNLRAHMRTHSAERIESSSTSNNTKKTIDSQEAKSSLVIPDNRLLAPLPSPLPLESTRQQELQRPSDLRVSPPPLTDQVYFWHAIQQQLLAGNLLAHQKQQQQRQQEAEEQHHPLSFLSTLAFPFKLQN